MTTRRKVFSGFSTLAAGQAFSQGMSFLRNMIVARMISREDFGVAATFAITVSLLEMISNMAWDKLLIQAPDGDEENLQSSAQLMMVLRGIINAMLIFALAYPITYLFKVPEAEWAFRWLAAVPFLRGMAHLDCKRIQREMQFRPDVTIEVVSQTIAVLLAWPLAAWLQDYSAMLWVVITQATILSIGSHLVASRPYRWKWDKKYVNRILTFGWPLAINGLLMFGILEGDRLIVGAGYSMQDLGVYSVAFALAMMPTVTLAHVSMSLLLPLLSRTQSDPDAFMRHYRRSAISLSLVSGAIAIAFILAGGWFTVLIYGQKYSQAGTFIGWLAVMQAIRLLRVTPTLAAMAMGDTKNLMITNIVRTIALVGALTAARYDAHLAWVAISGVVGELAASGSSLVRLRRCFGLSPIICIKPGVLVGIGTGLAGAAVIMEVPNGSWWLIIAVTLALQGALIVGFLAVFPEFFKEVVSFGVHYIRPNQDLGTQRS